MPSGTSLFKLALISTGGTIEKTYDEFEASFAPVAE